jgi:hypothetical protein
MTYTTTKEWIEKNKVMEIGRTKEYPTGRFCQSCSRPMAIVSNDKDSQVPGKYWVCIHNLFCELHGQEIEEVEE